MYFFSKNYQRGPQLNSIRENTKIPSYDIFGNYAAKLQIFRRISAPKIQPYPILPKIPRSDLSSHGPVAARPI